MSIILILWSLGIHSKIPKCYPDLYKMAIYKTTQKAEARRRKETKAHTAKRQAELTQEAEAHAAKRRAESTKEADARRKKELRPRQLKGKLSQPRKQTQGERKKLRPR